MARTSWPEPGSALAPALAPALSATTSCSNYFFFFLLNLDSNAAQTDSPHPFAPISSSLDFTLAVMGPNVQVMDPA